ncbi:MAG TPA: ABC transporter ATP-binding protein, partial [Chitinophagaceae bacterium]|nr:ABC transporter ATP-binding protein [Chitinophagaceae bacterium]
MEGVHIKQVFNFGLLRRLFSFAGPYKRRLYISVLLAILLAVVAVARPWLIQITVDKFVIAADPSFIGVHWLRDLVVRMIRSGGLVKVVVWITVIQIGILLLETLMRFYFSYLTSWMGQAVIKDLRSALYHHVIRLNIGFFDRTPIGTLTTRTVDDIEKINDIFSEGLISIVADLLTILVVMACMLLTDWRLTLVSLSIFPLLVLATYWFKESVNRSFHRVRDALARLNAFVQEHITGMFVVQAFAVEQRETMKFRAINKDYRKANIDSIFAYSVFYPVVEIISAVSIGLLVWYASVRIVHQHTLPGVIIGFVLYINLLFRPLRTLADKFNTLQLGMVCCERVFRLLDNKEWVADSGTLTPTRIRGEVSFEEVWFAYKPGQYVLRDISFNLAAGETLAIVGHTGAGKTSLISILNRLYEVQRGTIRVDGTDIRQYSHAALRAAIGVVLQDVFLFSGSILENITLRNTGITRQQVEQAASLIGMHEFIMRLPGNYDFNVMERGNTLSMGQRQLISF